MLKATEKIWRNGEFIAWDDARIHVLSHVVSYGSSVFEGIRCYETLNGPAVFRLPEHVRRMVDSAKIYRMDNFQFTREQLSAAILELVTINQMRSCYIRPIVMRGYGEMGVNGTKNPVDIYLACWEWGKYLGEEALSEGVDVCISSWNRFAPNTLPALAKAGANYMNSQLIKMEALANGYSEGIALDTSGFVSEGSGENVFLVHKDRIYTPPLANSVLPGITRSSVLQIAHDLGITVHEQTIPREFLYLADEVFFSGTAAEITPIRSVDKITVGDGKIGPVTRAVRSEFYAIANGKVEDRHGWLTPVPMKQPVAV